MSGRRAAVAVATAGLAFAAAGPAAAADPVLPLADVVPGMTGEARTVVRGTAIETFPVTVIDVQRSGDGPGGTLILVRASGPLMEATGGVAEGMSGSPVYVTGADGVARVIGAVAYGTGDQANVIVGVTPIEQMIDSSSGQRANAVARRAAAPVRRVRLVRDRAAAVALERRDPGRIGAYPLARWSVAGASRPLLAGLSRELRSAGVTLTAIGPRTPRPAVPLVPGASMSVMLSSGDLALGAVGTATWVDGATVLGFGHPFLRAGRARFLLGDGYVYQTIPAPIAGASYKLAEPGAVQGTVTGDRADGVTGVIGPAEGIAGVATATDVARGTRSTVRTTIAPDERTAPIVALLLQDEPVVRARDGVAAGTLTLRVSVTSPDLRRPFTYRNTYAAAGDVATLASGQAARIVQVLLQNGVRPVRITKLSISQRLEPRVRAARLVSARVQPRRVRAGGAATLVLRLQPWRAPAVTVRARFRVPGEAGPGPTGLRVLPGGADGFDPLAADLSQDLGVGLGAAARARAVRAAERAAPRAGGTRLARLMAGLRRITDDRNDTVRVLAPGDDPDDARAGVRVPVPYVVHAGRAGVRVVVR
ncbi:SpoIVB peptidase S55 domain-containing protein [Miltoncostaea marina]|uniref:SpoIVB peptidase S55 domain-containing protein n=1 Tax=Miltoncostaea marina TaxID=2843215 RepID=UPI001C3E41B1|nr:SpoIVB peptidase S55 domain-containing protein [Miltoncostaea marina]